MALRHTSVKKNKTDNVQSALNGKEAGNCAPGFEASEFGHPPLKQKKEEAQGHQQKSVDP